MRKETTAAIITHAREAEIAKIENAVWRGFRSNWRKLVTKLGVVKKDNDKVDAADDVWQDWNSEIARAISDAMQSSFPTLVKLESRWYEGVPDYSPAQIYQGYAPEIGNQITGINATTLRFVQSTVSGWLATPTSDFDELKSRLEWHFSQARANMIATTEMTRASSFISVDLMKKNGLSQWEWWTVNQDKLDECGARHGKIYGITTNTKPPLHVGCKCIMIPKF